MKIGATVANVIDTIGLIPTNLANLAKKESADQKALGKPFEMPPTALASLAGTPTAAKQIESTNMPTNIEKPHTELKLAGALELGSKEAYSVVAHARGGGSGGMKNLERINQDQLGALNKNNGILGNIAKRLGDKPRPLVI